MSDNSTFGLLEANKQLRDTIADLRKRLEEADKVIDSWATQTAKFSARAEAAEAKLSRYENDINAVTNNKTRYVVHPEKGYAVVNKYYLMRYESGVEVEGWVWISELDNRVECGLGGVKHNFEDGQRVRALVRLICPQCGGEGTYNTEVRARYGDPPYTCERCNGTGVLATKGEAR